jgi:hypothetical protein
MENLEALQNRIDSYIRRYYGWRLVRGLLVWGVVGIGPWMAISAGAFFLRLDSSLRLALLVLYLLAQLAVFFVLVLGPWMRLQGWLPRMSRKEAARRIGTRIPEIKDKLLNALDLSELSDRGISRDLVGASIEQRARWMHPFSFVGLISWQKLRPYAWVLGLFVAVLVGVWLWVPLMLSVGSQRIIQYQRDYVLPAPFDFDASGTPTLLEAGANWPVQLRAEGREIPKEAYVHWEGKAYRMRCTAPGRFAFDYPNLREGGSFYFSASGYESVRQELRVFHRPTLLEMGLWLDYPAYTGRAREQIRHGGDLQIPMGTRLRYELWSRHSKGFVLLPEGGQAVKATLMEQDKSRARHQAGWSPVQSGPYQVILLSNQGLSPDSLRFRVEVIQDAPPGIEVVRMSADSLLARSGILNSGLESGTGLFSGRVWDDYGIRSLQVVYSVRPVGKSNFEESEQRRSLDSEGAKAERRFDQLIDPSDFGLSPGQGMRFCFEVEDNDPFQGPKRTRTPYFEISSLSEEQRERVLESLGEEAAKGMENAEKDLMQAQNQTEKLAQKLKQQKELGWEEKKELESLLQEQKEVAREIQEIQQKLELQQQKTKPSTSSEILEKQQQIQEMADRLLNEEMKEILRNIEKMLREEATKPEIQKQLDKLQGDQDKVAKELDRMLQFFKELEVEDRLERGKDQLDRMARRQEDLSRQTKDGLKDLEQSASEQKDLQKEMSQWMEEWKETLEKNQELDRPKDLEGLEEMGQETQKDQQDAVDQAQEAKNRSKASQKQQKAGSGMQKMSAQLSQQLSAQEMEEMEEDLRAMRKLLGQVLKFSFDQERLIDRLKDQSGYSQTFVKISRDQFALRDQYDLIKDSLEALSKRVWQIQAPVQKEMKDLEEQFKAGLDRLTVRDIQGAKTRQQYTMTAANNLANLLSELLQQATEQKANQMPGNQQCKKPKAGGSGMARLKSMQKKLGEKMQEQMGKSPGQKPGTTPQGGSQPKRGQGGKEFADMVAQQEAIRREMEKMMKELNKEGKGGPGGKAMQEAIQQMEQTEKELVNKQLTQESLRRQQQILSRMLEAEKAEQEREMEQSRSSESAKEQKANPGKTALQDLLKQKRLNQALYKAAGPELNTYYKERNQRYQQEIQQWPSRK